jgi:hypothetical protein
MRLRKLIVGMAIAMTLAATPAMAATPGYCTKLAQAIQFLQTNYPDSPLLQILLDVQAQYCS